MQPRTALLFVASFLAGCPSKSTTEPTGAPMASTPQTIGKPPPVASTPPTTPAVAHPSASTAAPPPAPPSIVVPKSIGADKRPFVLFLHGLGASGKILENALHLPALAEAKRFSWAAPDGAMGPKSQRYWNASKACCDFDRAGLDHVAELRAILDAAAANPAVDPKRLFVVGYSNGGFMAHRLACEVPGIAGIVSVAGAGPAEGETCTPRDPVAVLQIHGDADEVIRYEGGHALGRASLPPHPSALQTVSAWATRDRCNGQSTTAGTIDIDDKLEGAETTVLRFAGCARPVELWTVKGGSHFVATGRSALDAILGFVEAHPRP